MTEIELHPGTPFCTAKAFNRIARQQGLEQMATWSARLTSRV